MLFKLSCSTVVVPNVSSLAVSVWGDREWSCVSGRPMCQHSQLHLCKQQTRTHTAHTNGATHVSMNIPLLIQVELHLHTHLPATCAVQF